MSRLISHVLRLRAETKRLHGVVSLMRCVEEWKESCDLLEESYLLVEVISTFSSTGTGCPDRWQVQIDIAWRL